MPRWLAAVLVLAPLLPAVGCLAPGGADNPANLYTINVVSAGEVAIGNDRETRFVNRNTRPGVVERQIAGRPGLEEALVRNGVDLDNIVNIRVRPTNVVDVFTRT